ncbi:MAG: PrsW family intramembrane metalloprotease [Deltaproteobacteria bacterium]|nr:MAG: PrsW family intramembrane metalloprotease [Deltaproteobacteria bacterium]
MTENKQPKSSGPSSPQSQEELDRLSLQQSLHTFPGLHRMLPLAEEGSFSRLYKQWYFWPALSTVVVGLALFVLLQLLLHTKWVGYAFAYEVVLGLYLGGLIVFAVVRIAGLTMPVWLILGPALLTAVLLWIGLPLSWLMSMLAPAPLRELARSPSFPASFVGYFFQAGLTEELLKSMPVWVTLAFSGLLARRYSQLFTKGRMHPLVAVVIGAASAVGFMLVETLLGYAPQLRQQGVSSLGLMVVIPRMLTGLCGHVAWAGILAYFLALSRYYKWRGSLAILGLGWVMSASLHALWNACQHTNIPITGAIIALTSFVMFVAYLSKAKEFFSRPSIAKVASSAAGRSEAMEPASTSMIPLALAQTSPLQTLMFGSFQPQVPKEEGATFLEESVPSREREQTLTGTQVLHDIQATDIWGGVPPELMKTQVDSESPSASFRAKPSMFEPTLHDGSSTRVDASPRDVSGESSSNKRNEGE